MKKVDFQDGLNKFFSTKGHKKLKNYFNDLLRKDIFQSDIKNIRKKFGIPENGFSEGSSVSAGLFHDNKISQELLKICNKYELNQSDWVEFLNIYLFFNKTNYNLFANLLVTNDLIGFEEFIHLGEMGSATIYDIIYLCQG